VRKTVIIVAGGKGIRMGGGAPKQFLELGGKPLIYYSMQAFIQFDSAIRILVGIPESYMEQWKNMCRDYFIVINHEVVAGGHTRFHTVLNALEKIDENELVAIHDAVRPFVSLGTIERCFQTAEKLGTAVPYTGIPESMREVRKEISFPVNRELYRIIQTPQVFKSEILKSSYLQEYQTGFTDDASVVEQAGYTIHLVKGNRENFKITTPEDYKIARAYFQSLSDK